MIMLNKNNLLNNYNLVIDDGLVDYSLVLLDVGPAYNLVLNVDPFVTDYNYLFFFT